MMNEQNRLLILYGSQTGTAQEIAENIWRQSRRYGLKGPVMAMDDYKIEQLIRERFVIFVCSTTGVGEEPDNMKKFWKFLLKKSLPSNSLCNLNYAVLGLGDSSYTKFNYPAKKLHKRLLNLGGTSLIDVGLCDYQHDLGHDGVFDPWIAKVWTELSSYFPSIISQRSNAVSYFIPRWDINVLGVQNNTTVNGNTNEFNNLYFTNYNESNFQDKPFLMVLEKNYRTTSDDHFQDVRLLTFKSDTERFPNHIPGDVLNVRPKNSPKDVDDFFDMFSELLDVHSDTCITITQRDSGPELAAAIGGESGGANTASSVDDEYRWAGVHDPKIVITTSRDPSAKLKMFVKEMRLIFPNSQRMNRGKYEMKQLIHACRANDVTDFIVIHEHRGIPSTLIVCHLPYGPTAFFQISDVIMRHDVPNMAPMSEQYPHLIFHNMKTELGQRTANILKYLFPVPKEDSKRVITFANHDDYICFRHHTYRKVEKNIELQEIGPRFTLRLYEIKLGTLDSLEAANKEWVLRPYMNTAVKRRFLSQEDGWQAEDDIDT